MKRQELYRVRLGQKILGKNLTEEEYFDANKLLSASFQIGSILGAGLGGFIVHFYTPFFALWINVFTYFLSAVFISFAPFKNIKSNGKMLSNELKISFNVRDDQDKEPL